MPLRQLEEAVSDPQFDHLTEAHGPVAAPGAGRGLASPGTSEPQVGGRTSLADQPKAKHYFAHPLRRRAPTSAQVIL